MSERTTEELRNMLLQKKQGSREPVLGTDLLSTGSTLLNLACSGRWQGGFVKGRYHFLVGDSASGKTFLSLTCLAEASLSRGFDGYRFIYDNAEDGALMDVERFFGRAVAGRIESPSVDKSGPVYSSTIEEFYFHVDDAVEKGTPFIYVLDSMDSLSSSAEWGKFTERKKAYRVSKEVPGSYGDGKAKYNSENLRKILPGLRDSGSILIVINQTRDNIGFGFETKTRSGGRALRFYAAIEIWSSVVGKIKRTVMGKERKIGIRCKVELKKNRVTGWEGVVEIPIYRSYGIDDVGSCVDYLVEERHWKKGTRGKTESGVVAEEFGFAGTKEALIVRIEEEGMEKDLRTLVAEVWGEIEERCAVERKKRY